MLLIVGLGNPGEKYKDTPHNAGFYFVEKLREFMGWDSLYSVDDWRGDKLFECELSFARAGSSSRVILVKPYTFMNASGRCVKKLMDKFEVKSKDLILVHDDLDIKLGDFKIQMGKGPRAHNGVDSVQMTLGTTQFLRVRIGIEDRDKDNKIPGEDYVLTKMSEDQLLSLNEACTGAVKSLRTLVEI